MAFLTHRLAQEGYDIKLLTYESDRTFQVLGQGVHPIDFKYSPPSIFFFRRLFQAVKVRKVIKEINPDIVISFLSYPNLISILGTLGTGIPVIISERGDPVSENGWFSHVKNFIYKFADGYVFQTNGAKNYYSKRIQEKGVVIPNPVIAGDIPEKWSGKREDIVVTVGRFELIQKRQDVLIRAFNKIADKYSNLKLILFGDGEDKPEIIKIIIDCNLEDKVILAGVTGNIYKAIEKAKLFVLSSDYEGIPNALIEAMCVGLPCISTDCSPGGAAELIENMVNGILVKAGCVDDLANAMEFMLDNPSIAETMGENAIKVIKRLDADVIIDQWNKYINNHVRIKSVMN